MKDLIAPLPRTQEAQAIASSHGVGKGLVSEAQIGHCGLTWSEALRRRSYKGRITLGTLRNWRALKIGPPYVKVGKAVLYSRSSLKAWDKRNTVICGKLP